MPRSARVQYEGARFHVINRGNYRTDLFRTHKTDESFAQVLFEACDRFDWWLHAYVLMSNHYYLCLEAPQANLSDGMHWLQSTFANKFSRFTGECGHVFQGRYQSLIFEGDNGLLNVLDCIQLNPVSARLLPVDQLKKYPNSSFPKYFTKHRPPSLRSEDFLHEDLLTYCLKQVGKTTQDIRTDLKSTTWKLAIASYLKSTTGIKNPLLCGWLNLGHPATMSNYVAVYNKTSKQKCPYAR